MACIARIIKLLLLAIPTVMASGCAYFTHYNKERDVFAGSGEAIYSDAKQRAVLATRRPNQKIELMRELRERALYKAERLEAAAEKAEDAVRKKNFQDQEKYQRAFAAQLASKILSGDVGQADMQLVAFCAEPSPDALSALSASGKLKIEAKGGSGAAQAAFAEAAGMIGLRTQSIQLMRDAMYRLCEGTMNGSLGNAAFETLHRRFQNSMVAILAIEQLTGVTRPPSLALGSITSTGVPGDLTALTQDTVKMREKVVAANNEKSAADDTVATKKKEVEEARKAKSKAEEDHANGKAEQEKSVKEGKAKKPTDVELAELKGKVDTAAETVTQREAALESASRDAGLKAKNAEEMAKSLKTLEDSLGAMREGRTTASANPEFERGSYIESELPRWDLVFVSNAVKSIVADFYDQGYIQEVCTTIFTSIADDEISPFAFKKFSDDFFYSDPDIGKLRISKETNVYKLCLDHIANVADQENEAVRKQREALALQESVLNDRQAFVDTQERRLETARQANLNKISNMRKEHEREIEQIEESHKKQLADIESILEKLKNSSDIIIKEDVPAVLEIYGAVAGEASQQSGVQLLRAWAETNSKDVADICNRTTRSKQARKILGDAATQNYNECVKAVTRLSESSPTDSSVFELKSKADQLQQQTANALKDLEDIKRLFDEQEAALENGD